jgi:lysine-N-methylase
MKPVYVPNYYLRFRCIAAACRHSCCVGWEIDVDEASLTRYDAVEGDIGRRLRESIDREADPPCFRLTPDERCPFLNQNGLCDLITELGEDSLCHICADHPRFRNILPDRVELGLGLCCEAAATLILGQTEITEVEELPQALAAGERYAHEAAEETDTPDRLGLNLREKLMHIAQNRRYTLGERIAFAGEMLGLPAAYPAVTYPQWAEFLRETEELDPARRPLWDALENLDGPLSEELQEESGLPYEKLLCYFLYRYVAAERYHEQDWRYTNRIRFAFVATALIHAMARATGQTDFDGICEVARIFSSEIEYSEDNLLDLWDLIEITSDRHEPPSFDTY